MKFLTVEESRRWARTPAGLLDSAGYPTLEPAGLHSSRFVFATEAWGRLYWLAQRIVDTLGVWDDALMWVVLAGVWGSSENLHLYYRVRQSYGDLRHLDDAPGHLCLAHEHADLTTFLHLAMLNGWDAHVMTSPDRVRAFVSHDGYANFWAAEESNLAGARDELVAGGVKLENRQPSA